MSVGTVQEEPKLLFVAPYFPPAFYGGVVQVYLGLLQRLRGFQVSVVADRVQSTSEQTELWDALAARELHVDVRRIAAFELHLRQASGSTGLSSVLSPVRKAVDVLRFFREGRRDWQALLRELRPDVVVCGGTYSAGWLMVDLPRSVRLINYLHGEELTMQMRPRLLTAYMRRYQMACLRRGTLNIAVSQYTAQLTQSLARVAPEKVKVLPNFVDVSRFHPAVSRESLRALRHWTDKLVVLTIARLERRKGIDQALRGLALLKRQGRLPADWIYVIAGRGGQETALRKLSQELHLASHVSFLGFVSNEDMVELYQAADIFLQPNREIDGDTEGFGIVFLEASACGLPVVGGVAGGTAEAIEEGFSGYRVDGESVEAIASAMARLAQDPDLRRRMGEQGANRVASRFTVEEAAARFSEMLSDVVAEQRL